MVSLLDDAQHSSSDPVTAPSIVTSKLIKTGGRGRPRIELDENILTHAMKLRTTSHLASVFGCNARTIRRRALDYGIAQPGAPICVEQEHPDGSTTKQYNSVPQPIQQSPLSDAELDSMISGILQQFPKLGRRKLHAQLQVLGQRVPIPRITASKLRVQGVPARFGDRSIVRRKYFVPGANSLWHHDGQHGKFFFSKFST